MPLWDILWLDYNQGVIVAKKELLFSVTKKDFDIEFFSGTGGGGQHRNKHQNCVRMRHKESGVRVTGQSNKERQANIREAFNNLVKNPKFKFWLNKKTNEVITGKTLEDKVRESMVDKNLLIEGKNKKGQWDPDAIND